MGGMANPQVDGIRRWGLWEVIRSLGEAPIDVISIFIKETPEISLLPCENPMKRQSHMNQEIGVSRFQVCGHLDLGLSASTTLKKRTLVSSFGQVRSFSTSHSSSVSPVIT